jgi:hypothetical protein
MLAEAALLVSLSVTHGPEADGCATRAELSRAVERRLKRRVFVAAEQAQLRLDVAFAKRGSEVVATIRLVDAEGRSRGTRSLTTASHCSALDDSLALSIALLVDEPPEPEPEAAPEAAAPIAATPEATAAGSKPPPRPAREPTSITIPSEVAAPREPWHFSIGVAGAVAWGLLPEVRPAIVGWARLVPRRFVPIILQGEGFWASEAARDASSGARFQLWRAALALCPTMSSSESSSFGLCAGQKLGWLTVEGYGFDQNLQDRRLSFALSLGAEGRQLLWKPFSLRGYLGAEIPLVRDRFTSGGENAVELFRPSPVAFGAELGLEAALW